MFNRFRALLGSQFPTRSQSPGPVTSLPGRRVRQSGPGPGLGSRPGLPPRRLLLRRSAVGALAATAVLSVTDLVAGLELDYTRGFAPAVVGVAAAALGLLGVTFRSLRWRVLAGWTGAVLLLWCGAGVIFDLMRAAGVLGVPGLPPVVDVLGLVRRGAALVAAVLLAGTVVPRPSTQPTPPVWGIAAALLALPYPALKVYSWAGGTLAREFVGDADTFPVWEVGMFGLAAACGLALVAQRGGRVARQVLMTGSLVASVALLSMGALAGFGTLADVIGLVDGPFEPSGQGLLVGAVYGSWLGLGLCLGRAAWQSGAMGRGWASDPDDRVL